MKKLVAFLSVIFFCAIAFGETININWIVGNTVYDTSTCTVGDDLILPTAPTKRGHTFVGWQLSEYIILAYIESTGTQFIETGVNIAKFVHDIAFTVRNTHNLMGSSPAAYLYWGQNRQTNDGFELGSRNIDTTSLERQIVVYDIRDRTNVILTADNQTVRGSANANSGQYCLLRICNSAEYYSHARLYSFQAYDDNDVLIRDMVPAKRTSDNAIGMYDKVTDTFFPNAGTGEFIAGSAL